MPQLRWWEGWTPRRWTPSAGDQLGVALAALQKQGERPRPNVTGQEFGGSGTPVGGGIIKAEDYNRALQGKGAVITYDKMRRGDAQVAASLKLLKLPLLSAQWTFMPPEDGDAQDQQTADFCNSVIVDDDAMLETFSFSLRHFLLKLDFGFSPLELVWMLGPQGEYRYQRLAPRLPVSVEEWRVDENGQLVEMLQKVTRDNREQTVAIPAEYLAVFVHEREGDNYNGISALRPAYKHWYFKDQLYNIDAIRHQRFGAGTPMAQLGPGANTNPATLARVEEILEGMNAHHRAYIISPEGYTFSILTPQGSNSSGDLMQSVEHHDVMIARNILAPFLNVGQAPNGSRSSTGELIDVFYNSLDGIALEIAADFKRQITKPICDLNFNMEGRSYPTLVARNIRATDKMALATAIKALVDSDMLTPDDQIEDGLRKLMGFAPLAEGLKRGDDARPEDKAAAREAQVAQEAARQAQDARGGAPAARTGPQRVAASQRSAGPVELESIRNPTDFERQVLSFMEIPSTLDGAVAALVARLTAIREKQIREASKGIAASVGTTFEGLRASNIVMKYQGEVLAAVQAAQKLVARYGAEQVRLELKRQGAPIELRADEDEDQVLTLDIGPGPAASLMKASASNVAASLTAQLQAVIADIGTRLARAGIRGAELQRRIGQEATQSASRNIATAVRGEINEAFAVGRSAEASRRRSLIVYAVQSSLLDQGTCVECKAVDGEEFPYGSPRQIALQPPYVECKGRENCRCVQLYAYSG